MLTILRQLMIQKMNQLREEEEGRGEKEQDLKAGRMAAVTTRYYYNITLKYHKKLHICSNSIVIIDALLMFTTFRQLPLTWIRQSLHNKISSIVSRVRPLR